MKQLPLFKGKAKWMKTANEAISALNSLSLTSHGDPTVTVTSTGWILISKDDKGQKDKDEPPSSPVSASSGGGGGGSGLTNQQAAMLFALNNPPINPSNPIPITPGQFMGWTYTLDDGVTQSAIQPSGWVGTEVIDEYCSVSVIALWGINPALLPQAPATDPDDPDPDPFVPAPPSDPAGTVVDDPNAEDPDPDPPDD
jgi:hypothetical protein